MTKQAHLHCDRCGADELINPRKQFMRQTGWAHFEVGLEDYDICQNCWKIIAEHAELKPKTEEDWGKP